MNGPPSTQPARRPQPVSAVLWIVPAIYFVFVAAEFALMTHLALQATAEGRSALAVGLLSSAMWAGILLASGAAHRVVQRLGHAHVFIGATALAFLATAAAALHTHFGGWLAGAFVLGLGGGLVWVAGEAWLAEAAPPARRGFFVGLFETAVGLGLMVGPALVPLTAWAGVATPVASATLMLGAAAVSLLLRGLDAPGSDTDALPGTVASAELPAWRTLALPLCGVAVLSGLMESGVSALLPSISMRLGATLEAAAWLGAVIGAGSALLQPPAGHLADRFGTARITLAAWLVLLLATGLLLATASDPGRVLWGVGFTLGGVGGAVYTLMIVELGHRLTGSALVRSIGLLVTAYALGTAAGPTIGGLLFDAGGLATLAAALLGLSACGLAASLRAQGGGRQVAPPRATP
jgi:MFS family permease